MTPEVSVHVDRDPTRDPFLPEDIQGNALTVPTLTDRQNKFCDAFTSGETMGQTVASALAAGFSDSYAKGKAYQLLKLPQIVFRVNQLIAEKSIPMGDRTVQEMFGELQRVAFFDIGDLFEKTTDKRYPGGLKLKDLSLIDTRAIKSLQIKAGTHGLDIKIVPYDKIDAMRLYMQGKGVLDSGLPPSKSVVVNFFYGNKKPGDPPPPKVVNPDGHTIDQE